MSSDQLKRCLFVGRMSLARKRIFYILNQGFRVHSSNRFGANGSSRNCLWKTETERYWEKDKNGKNLPQNIRIYYHIYMSIERIIVSIFRIILKLSHQDDQSIPQSTPPPANTQKYPHKIIVENPDLKTIKNILPQWNYGIKCEKDLWIHYGMLEIWDFIDIY